MALLLPTCHYRRHRCLLLLLLCTTAIATGTYCRYLLLPLLLRLRPLRVQPLQQASEPASQRGPSSSGRGQAPCAMTLPYAGTLSPVACRRGEGREQARPAEQVRNHRHGPWFGSTLHARAKQVSTSHAFATLQMSFTVASPCPMFPCSLSMDHGPCSCRPSPAGPPGAGSLAS